MASPSSVSPGVMITAIQSGGYAQDGVGLMMVGDGFAGVLVEVRVGSPGARVGMMGVGVGVFVFAPGALDVSVLLSANEIVRLPKIRRIETRAARSPEVSSRRLVMAIPAFHHLKAGPGD